MESETLTNIFAIVGLIVVMATPIAAGLESAARKFQEYALTTPTEGDDKTAEALVKWSARISGALRWLSGVLPVVSRRGKGDRE